MAKSTNRPVKVNPLPEAVDHSKDWVIRESNSMFGASPGLDYKSGVMTVPMSATPYDRVVRNREMLKLKFSPKAFPRLPAEVDPGIYKACETARVDYRGGLAGVVHDTRLLTDAQIEDFSKEWVEKPQNAAALLMQYGQTEDGGNITRKLLDMRVDGDMDTVMYYDIIDAVSAANRLVRRGKAPGPKQAIKAAQIITQSLTPPPPAPPEATGGKSSTGPDGADVVKQVKKGVDSMKQQDGNRGRSAEKLIAESVYKHGDKPDLAKIDSAQWCTMHIRRPERPLIFPARLKSKKWRPTDQGSVFRYPHRWLADQTGFAYKGIKEGGCSMLIDVSGSMSLTEADILTVMTYMPASLIATYSGNRTDGWLTIVGEKGRRAEKRHFRHPNGGANGVDGPALRWLAKQKGPRYWISDGYVTGRDGHTVSLLADAMLICRQNYIMRIDSMEDVIAQFEKYGYGKRK